MWLSGIEWDYSPAVHIVLLHSRKPTRKKIYLQKWKCFQTVQSPIYTSSWVLSNTHSQLPVKFKNLRIIIEFHPSSPSCNYSFLPPNGRILRFCPPNHSEVYQRPHQPLLFCKGICSTTVPLCSPQHTEETPIWNYGELFPPSIL